MIDPADIALAVCVALRTLDLPVKLTETTCYVIAVPQYIEGQQQVVVQVSPGPINLDSPGKGSQEGGALERVLSLDVAVWVRIKLDSHRKSQTALLLASNSLFSILAKIRKLFEYTYLKGKITEPLWFLGETQTEVWDEDDGIYRRDISFGAKWGQSLPTTLSY